MLKTMRQVVRLAMFVCLVVSLPAAALAGEPPLVVYAGAGLMKPMDELKSAFEARHHVPVQLVYGGSGELFGMIATRKSGDVFIPGAAKYIQDAVAQGLARQGGQQTVCYHVPVILVPAGNPGRIASLSDFARPGVKIALADAKAAAIGKVADAMLKKLNLVDAVAKNVVVRPSTTNQLLLYTATGQVDACLAWEDQATWAQAKGKVAMLRIPAGQNMIKTIPAALVTYSRQPEKAQAFIDFIASDQGKALWKKWGFPIQKPQ